MRSCQICFGWTRQAGGEGGIFEKFRTFSFKENGPAETTRAAPEGAALEVKWCFYSTLTGFEPALRLVDDVDAAFATHNAAVTMPILERAERIANFHARILPYLGAGQRRVAGDPANGTSETGGGRYWDRTSDPFGVNEVLYR